MYPALQRQFTLDSSFRYETKSLVFTFSAFTKNAARETFLILDLVSSDKHNLEIIICRFRN